MSLYSFGCEGCPDLLSESAVAKTAVPEGSLYHPFTVNAGEEKPLTINAQKATLALHSDA